MAQVPASLKIETKKSPTREGGDKEEEVSRIRMMFVL